MQNFASTEKQITRQKQEVLIITEKDTITQNEHDCLSWTACYNDLCVTHWSNKDDSEWFLKALKRT